MYNILAHGIASCLEIVSSQISVTRSSSPLETEQKANSWKRREMNFVYWPLPEPT